MSVELSAASLTVLLTAPLMGLGFLTARMLGTSGRVTLTYETLARSKADIAVIVVYDISGAIVAVCGIVLLGITKPATLVSYFATDPWIAWPVFGVLGPVLAVGILDRLPVIRWASLALQEVNGAAMIDSASLRRKSVERILKCHYEDVLVTVDNERNSLLHKAKRLIDDQWLHFDDIAHHVTRYVDEFRAGEMPPEVAKIIERRKAWPTDYDAFSGAETLAAVAIEEGLGRPVNIACRIAEKSATSSL